MKWISITLLQNIKKKNYYFTNTHKFSLESGLNEFCFCENSNVFINHDKGKNHQAEKEEGVEEWKKKAAQSRVRLDQDKEAVARE